MYTETEIRIDLGRLFAALWKKKGLILLAGLLGAVLAVTGSFLVTPKYETAVTFFAETAEQARQAAVLLKLEQTLRETAVAAGGSYDAAALAEMVTAEEVKETGFLRVTVRSADSGEGKAIADAVAEVLPKRAEAVLGGGVALADPAVLARDAAVPDRPMAGLVGGIMGVFLAAGAVGFGVVFTVGGNGERKM